MTNEEIQLKLGLDASQFSTGLRTMQKETESAGREAHKSFLHAESSARGFHKVLEQLNDTVPGLGDAFKLISNPVTGAFALAAVGLAKAKDALKEWNAEMDRQAEAAAKPIWSKEQVTALKNEIADAHKEYKEFLKSLHPSNVSAELEAITGEKDETKRAKQARTMQERIVSERDAALKEREILDKEVDALKTEKAKLPAALEATKKFAEEQKKVPIYKKFRSIDPAGGVHEIETNERDFEAEEKREIQLDTLIRRMEARKEANSEKVREHAERRKQLESTISEKQKATEQLTKIREEGEMSEMEEAFYGKGKRQADVSKLRLSRKEGGVTVMDTGEITFRREAFQFIRDALTNGVPVQPKQGE